MHFKLLPAQLRRHGSGAEGDWNKLPNQLASLRVVQANHAVEAGGSHLLAIGPIRQCVDSPLLASSPMTRLVSRCILYKRGTPSEPATANSLYKWSRGSGGDLTILLSCKGRRATAIKPPLSAPGVMLVMLSMKRCVATSVSFI